MNNITKTFQAEKTLTVSDLYTRFGHLFTEVKEVAPGVFEASCFIPQTEGVAPADMITRGSGVCSYDAVAHAYIALAHEILPEYKIASL